MEPCYLAPSVTSRSEVIWASPKSRAWVHVAHKGTTSHIAHPGHSLMHTASIGTEIHRGAVRGSEIHGDVGLIWSGTQPCVTNPAYRARWDWHPCVNWLFLNSHYPGLLLKNLHLHTSNPFKVHLRCRWALFSILEFGPGSFEAQSSQVSSLAPISRSVEN